MARRSQCSDAGDNPLDPNYLPPHYREEYRLAIDALVEEDVDGYYKFLQFADVVDFLSPSEMDYIQHSVQLPKQQSGPEQRYLDPGADGSSDTYWPLHSDLDAPGLDLGWPQIHHFIGPTEVTTLVNPAAPDMPSIKEQARRLIKNAQMVIAVVMDMFTDVDIFADILNAASRNVAVYLLLDEANVDHFINMVSNCRVNLQKIPYLRVRTVTGIRYHCRTGKSFKGQMLDRFILTDCRAVLSGNYSFMWSYEKLHRCMAHLFLGQLVTTFDEEFRILFALSEPLVIENMDDMSILKKRPLPGERPLLRDTRKYRTMDTGLQEDWNRPPYEENVDWRMMQHKRQETFHGPLDIYNRYQSPQPRLDPQTRLDPQFDQGPPRMMDSLAHKRHGFAEGGPGRYSLPYQQQGVPDVEPPGRPYYRGQQHLHPRDEPDYGGYGQAEKFWNQDFQQEEPYPEPGYEPQEGFDPVFNYLSSTRNVEMDQSSDKLIPGPDLPYTTTHPRRHNIGQAYACQTSPTSSNTAEKRFTPEHSGDRKDPTVKRGLRNWRISSYLSAYDNSEEPEGLPMGQDQTVDPFDDMPNPTQRPMPPPPAVVELAVPKIPNVREFKVPVLPRASQMLAFAKGTPRDFPKRFPDEIPQVTPPVLVIPEPKVVTPTPSESSSTTDGEKQEEPEQREPITSTLRRDDSFRRNYNAAAVLRSSRLRSSLIFSSLEQNPNQDNTEQDDDKTKTETDTTKLPFSQVLAQRRSGTREPFEWRNYIKPTDTAKTDDDGSKPAQKDSESKLESVKERQGAEKSEAAKTKEVAKTKEAAKSPELALKVDKASPKIEPQPPPVEPNQPTKSFINEPFVDMNDPDQRFLFFKELAAKRRAEKAAEEAKLKQESAAKDKVQEKTTKDVVGTTSEKPSELSKKTDVKTLGLFGKKDKVESVSKNLPTATQSCEKVETKIVKGNDGPNKEGKAEKTKEEGKKDVKTLDQSSKIAKIDSSVITKPTPMQSCEKIEAKVATDSQKIEAKQSQAPQPTTTDKLAQEKQASPKTDAIKTAEKQDEPAGASAVGKGTDEAQPATTSKDPQLKPSRSVPDFTKTSFSDLLSSLPSSRIYERSSTQEPNKDTGPKSRLWSPSLPRRDSLKAYGEKMNFLSTVVQEEAADETGQTVAEETSGASKSQEISSVKFQITDKTETKVEPATSASESKESDKVKSPFLSLISEKTQNTQPQQEGVSGKSASSGTEVKKDNKEPSPSPVSSGGASKKTSTSPEKVMPESGKSTTGTPDMKEDRKDSTHSTSATKEKTELAAEKAVDKKEGKVSQEQDKATSLASISDTKQPQASQNKDALVESVSIEVKDLEKPNQLAEKATKDQPKTELNQTQPEKGSDRQVDTSVKSEKMAEKSTVETAAKTKPSGKDSAKGSPEKTSVTREEASVTSPVDDAKQKLPDDATQFEPHSNTSSPASFATALEFISSEDSDVFSPARSDPQNLFRLRNNESSMSDTSDFETPNSEISMSPMPFAVNMDDSIDDNESIAETVIEAVSRRISEGKMEGRMQEASSKESPQIETPKERLSPEIHDLDATTSKSEAKTQSATSGEASGSNLATQDTEKASKAGKIGGKSEKEIGNATESSSQVQQETKLPDKAAEVTSESSAEDESKKDLQSETLSTNVKTQDVTGQSDSNAQTSGEATARPTSQATSGETKDSAKDGAKTTEPSKDSPDVKSLGASEAETPTNQPTTSPKTVAQESPSEGSESDTKTTVVSKSTKLEAEIKPESAKALPTNQSTTSPKTVAQKSPSEGPESDTKPAAVPKSTELGKESTEAEIKPEFAKPLPTNQSTTSPKTVPQELPSKGSENDTKTAAVSKSAELGKEPAGAEIKPESAKTFPTNQPTTSPKTVAQESPSKGSENDTKTAAVSKSAELGKEPTGAEIKPESAKTLSTNQTTTSPKTVAQESPSEKSDSDTKTTAVSKSTELEAEIKPESAKTLPTNQSTTSTKTAAQESPSEGSESDTKTTVVSKSTELEAEIKPESAKTLPTNQSTTSPKAVAQEPSAGVSKRETKTRTVSSRFLSPPSVASVKNQTSAVTPQVKEEVAVVEKTAKIKEESQSTNEVSSGSTTEMGKETKEKKGQDQEACESETKLVTTNTNAEIQATLEVKTEEKTTDKDTKEVSTASGSVVNEKGEVPSHTSPKEQSETCPAKQEDSEKPSQDAQADVGKEKLEVTSSTSQATSEDTKVLEKEAEIVKETSAEDKSEQKSGVNEAAPPKTQTKPSPSRYLSSTANVISSSNLRDDTKILLEQISAQSQSRNEQTAAAKEAPVTDDEKEDEADKNAKRKKENELRSSLGQQKSSQDREKVLERIQTMRKDRRVYSRFEL